MYTYQPLSQEFCWVSTVNLELETVAGCAGLSIPIFTLFPLYHHNLNFLLFETEKTLWVIDLNVQCDLQSPKEACGNQRLDMK